MVDAPLPDAVVEQIAQWAKEREEQYMSYCPHCNGTITHADWEGANKTGPDYCENCGATEINPWNELALADVTPVEAATDYYLGERMAEEDSCSWPLTPYARAEAEVRIEKAKYLLQAHKDKIRLELEVKRGRDEARKAYVDNALF